MLASAMPYIRFVVEEPDTRDHRLYTGLFTAARELIDKDEHLERFEIETIESVFKWFNENLPVPPYPERWPDNSAAWFKDGAGNGAVTRMWELYGILQRAGIPVRMLRSKNPPGKLLYDDDFQVVVEEWSRL